MGVNQEELLKRFAERDSRRRWERQAANRTILDLLREFNDQNPDLRFHQLLAAVEAVVYDFDPNEPDRGPTIRDEFHVEPEVILKRIHDRLLEQEDKTDEN